MKTSNRRQFLSALPALSGAFSVATAQVSNLPLTFPKLSPDVDVTHDEDFWHQIKQAYSVSPTLINLNNGGVSPQPRVVQEAVEYYNRLSNETPSYYMWRILDRGRSEVRRKLAMLADAPETEIAICRNTTEALANVIFGLPLQKGDEVVLSRQDYPNMINAWKQREIRDGVVLRWVDLDLPSEDEGELVKRYQEAITPHTKVLHLTHLINWCGQVLPAKKLVAMAHDQGVEVVLDAAHTFAHLPMSFREIDADYAGTSLHKWLCAPYGSGMLHVKRKHIAKIYPLMSAPDVHAADITKFEHLGTRSFAIEQAIAHAIDFHQMIGTERKFKRLHFLKNYWMNALAGIPNVDLGTSRDQRFGGAVGLVSIKGMQPTKVANVLLDKHRIHAVGINWENISGLRVTPNVYTLTSDLDVFISAMKKMAADPLGSR